MVVKCVVCEKTWHKPGAANLVSHGCCETGICEKAWNDWLDLPHPKPELRVYYKALVAGRTEKGDKVA